MGVAGAAQLSDAPLRPLLALQGYGSPRQGMLKDDDAVPEMDKESATPEFPMQTLKQAGLETPSEILTDTPCI